MKLKEKKMKIDSENAENELYEFVWKSAHCPTRGGIFQQIVRTNVHMV